MTWMTMPWALAKSEVTAADINSGLWITHPKPPFHLPRVLQIALAAQVFLGDNLAQEVVQVGAGAGSCMYGSTHG